MSSTALLEQIQSTIVYAPIPLFAESLRVQKAIVSAILTDHSVLPCLTGCIKDLGRLWEIDDFELLGQFDGTQTKVVTSIRHGNTFQLVNQAILNECKLTGRKSSKALSRAHAGLRETVVHVSFVTPGQTITGYSRTASWIYFCFTALETGLLGTAAAALALNGIFVGAALAGCVCTATIILCVLRWSLHAVFGNRHAILSDQVITARGGAALDIHVIADNWNSPRLDVLCGYSSQLHSLTNIPVRIDSPRMLRWSCRLLALILVLQAALLASIPNSTNANQWSGALWVFIYLSMSAMDKSLQYCCPKTLLEKQPATVDFVEPIHFSGRQAALLFITLLPVSHKADRWAWWDVFMPDNERRRSMQKEFETFAGAMNERESQASTEKNENITFDRVPTSNPIFLEAFAALKRCEVNHSLQVFMAIVSPKTISCIGEA